MSSPFIYRHAARILHAGGVIAYPTEAVFGLGCDPLDHDAFERLLEIKGRALDKGVILIAADIEQLLPYLAPGWQPDSDVVQTWPGPVTWIIPAHPDCPVWLTGGRPTIAVRVTAHKPTANLCDAFGGAIVSTSANRSGHPPIRSTLRLQTLLGPEIDYLLHAPLGGASSPSEIRDSRTGQVVRSSS